jgi:hypothetical protein
MSHVLFPVPSTTELSMALLLLEESSVANAEEFQIGESGSGFPY